MLNKEELTEKTLSDERLRLTNDFIKSLSIEDFKSMDQFGIAANHTRDRQYAMYTVENGKFYISEGPKDIMRSFIYNELSNSVMEDILDISETDEEYSEQVRLVIDSAFSKVKVSLQSTMKYIFIEKYQKIVDEAIEKLKEQGKLDDSNPYSSDSARIRKELMYNDVLDPEFDFNRVSLLGLKKGNTASEWGFKNYVQIRLKALVMDKKDNRTPEQRVISEINKYYNSLPDKEKARIQKIISKNNNELAYKIEASKDKIEGQNGVLKYNSPVSNKFTFYQTAFGLWSVSVIEGSEPSVIAIYTITSKSISDAVNVSKSMANRFQLGIMPVWVANKMYLRK